MSKNYSIYLYNCYFFKENYKHINGFGMTIRYLPFFKDIIDLKDVNYIVVIDIDAGYKDF
jgi:hypothetical protein